MCPSAVVAIVSNSSCSEKKFGPFTFQRACLAWNFRSTTSARRALSSSTSCSRREAGMSIFVGYVFIRGFPYQSQRPRPWRSE